MKARSISSECGGKGLHSHDAAGSLLKMELENVQNVATEAFLRIDVSIYHWHAIADAKQIDLVNSIMYLQIIPHKRRVSNISGSTVTITTLSGQCTPERGQSENTLTIRQPWNGSKTSDETHQPRDDRLLPEITAQSWFSSDVETNPVTLQAVCKDVSFLISMLECLHTDFQNDQGKSSQFRYFEHRQATWASWKKNRASAKKSHSDAKIRKKTISRTMHIESTTRAVDRKRNWIGLGPE